MNPITGSPLYASIDHLTRAQRDARREQRSQAGRKVGTGVFFADPVTHFFLPEKERFSRNFAEEEKMRREQEWQRREGALSRHREYVEQRELSKWDREDLTLLKTQARLEAQAAKWRQGQKNKTSDAYNPISLEYDNTLQGEMLKKADAEKYNRALLRFYHLDQKCNQRYNLLNGEERRVPELPRPWQFA